MYKLNHYVPILKWKRAEQTALRELESDDKKNITPLIQLVLPKPKSSKDEMAKMTDEEILDEMVLLFEEKLPKIPEEIRKSWGETPIFIDLGLLYGTKTTKLKVETFEKLMREGDNLDIRLIPVINFGDNNSIQEATSLLSKKFNSGLCVRLVCSDFVDLAQLNKKIKEFLRLNNLDENSIDLLIDIKEIGDNNDKYAKYFDLAQGISHLSKWRTLIFACGAFPPNLTQCKFGEENYIPRLDWQNWSRLIKDKKVVRKPSFADYTIQYPIYDPSLQFFHPSTSIKYTLENEWYIMKGRKQKFELYLANAQLLANCDEFFGENFSYGDKYIEKKAKHRAVYLKNPKKIKGTGTAETWLAAGINHHLVCSGKQVSNLF